MSEQNGLLELLRAAWENGRGYGDDLGFAASADDAAFAEWLGEHAAELGAALGEFGEGIVAVQRQKLANEVRALQGPMAWHAFRQKHKLAGKPMPGFVRALADEIAGGES